VVVFGREPAAGRVKTRLAAGIGGPAAARVYAVTLEHSLEAAIDSGARVVLSLAAAPSDEWARGIECSIEVQGTGDLGDRMADAFERHFSETEERVIIVGSDCPLITPEHLLAAADALAERDVVLGPAIDGGYWLVGQRRPGVDLFSDIPWSSHDTLDQTRQRLADVGASWTEIDELRDIDTKEDFEAALDDPRMPQNLADRMRVARDGLPLSHSLSVSVSNRQTGSVHLDSDSDPDSDCDS
jgi:rSAM/selenodomain-associated transferase 1